jgi:hypothetical protein
MPATMSSRTSKLTRISCLPSTTRLPLGQDLRDNGGDIGLQRSERLIVPLPSADMFESVVRIREPEIHPCFRSRSSGSANRRRGSIRRPAR